MAHSDHGPIMNGHSRVKHYGSSRKLPTDSAPIPLNASVADISQLSKIVMPPPKKRGPILTPIGPPRQSSLRTLEATAMSQQTKLSRVTSKQLHAGASAADPGLPLQEADESSDDSFLSPELVKPPEPNPDRFNIGILKAMDGLREVLERNIAEHGPQHASVAQTYDHMAELCMDQGDFDGSIDFSSKAMEIHKTANGPLHPNVVASLQRMGVSALHNGKFLEAVDFFTQVKNIHLQQPFVDQPAVAAALLNIGEALTNENRFDDALDVCNQALEIMKASLGPDHPSVGMTIGNMGKVLQAQGKLKEAYEKHNEALNILKVAHGPMHMSVGIVLKNMADVLRDQGDDELALDRTAQALKVKKAALWRRSDVYKARAVDEHNSA